MPVSVWSYTLNDDDDAVIDSCQSRAADAGAEAGTGRRRRLLMMEPVNSITAHVSVDSHVSFAVFTYVRLDQPSLYSLLGCVALDLSTPERGEVGRPVPICQYCCIIKIMP